MRTSVKFIAFLLVFCMLAGSFSVFAFSENVTDVPKLEASREESTESPFYDIVCSYDKERAVIDVSFRMKNENVKKYEGSFVSLYKLSGIENIESVESGAINAVVSEIPVANRTGCEIRPVGLEARLSKYVLAIKDSDGKLAYSKPFYPAVGGNDLPHGFKGAEIGNVNDTVNVYPDTVIIDIQLENLESQNGGYLYSTEYKTYTFGRDFLNDLDMQMRVYSGIGANVYLRFSESRGFPAITSGSYDSESAIYAYTSFLSERYASDEYCGIAGFILGDSSTLHSDTDVEAYSNSLYALLAAISDGNYGSGVIVPINDAFASAEAFLEKICERFSGAARTMFTVMVESRRNPFGIDNVYTDTYDAIFYPDEYYGSGDDWSDDDRQDYDSKLEAGLPPLSSSGEYISSENMTRLFSLLRRLKNSTGCVNDNVIFNWQVSEDTLKNAALTSFVYDFYKLLFSDRVSSFVLKIPDSYDKYSRELLLNAVKYVDSDRVDKYIDKDRIASYFGENNFEALVFGFSDSNAVKRKINNYSALKNRPVNILGSAAYFDFSEASSQSGWYAGSNCTSISSVKNNSTRYMQAKMLSKNNENAFLSYNYEYSESFKYTDFIALEFSVSSVDPSNTFNISVVLGGEGFSHEYKAYGFFANTKYTIYLDTTEINGDMLTDYLRIGVSNTAQSENYYQLDLYSLNAMSKEYDDDQLTRLIESERERLKSSADDAFRNDIDYTALVFVVFVVLLTFAVMLMISRRQKKNREKERQQ